MFAESFLNSSFLEANPYREHKDMNFDDKIFEHEPINKFYDLPMVKKFAFESLQKVNHLCNPLVLSSTKLTNLEQKVIGEVDKIFSEANRLLVTSHKFEYILWQIMRITNGKKYSTEFRDTILVNPFVDDYIKQLF